MPIHDRLVPAWFFWLVIVATAPFFLLLALTLLALAAGMTLWLLVADLR